MHSIVTTFRGAVIKVEVANFCAAMDTLIDQDSGSLAWGRYVFWIPSMGPICLVDQSLAWGRYVFWIPSMGQICLLDP